MGEIPRRHRLMAKAYSDDLRRRVLQSWEEGKQTQAEIGQRFHVSIRYIGKIVHQKKQTGQAERIPHRPGRKSLFTPPIGQQLRDWLKSQPDLTLAELQEKLRQGEHLHVSLFSIWRVLGKMGLRLKKSRSTRRSRTHRRSSSSARRISKK